MSQQNRGSRGQRSPPTINAQLLRVGEETVRTGWCQLEPHQSQQNQFQPPETKLHTRSWNKPSRTGQNQFQPAMLSWDQEGSLTSPRTSSWSDLVSVLDPLLSSQPSRWDQLNSDEMSLTVKTSRILSPAGTVTPDLI